MTNKRYQKKIALNTLPFLAGTTLVRKLIYSSFQKSVENKTNR